MPHGESPTHGARHEGQEAASSRDRRKRAGTLSLKPWWARSRVAARFPVPTAGSIFGGPQRADVILTQSADITDTPVPFQTSGTSIQVPSCVPGVGNPLTAYDLRPWVDKRCQASWQNRKSLAMSTGKCPDSLCSGRDQNERTGGKFNGSTPTTRPAIRLLSRSGSRTSAARKLQKFSHPAYHSAGCDSYLISLESGYSSLRCGIFGEPSYSDFSPASPST